MNKGEVDSNTIKVSLMGEMVIEFQDQILKLREQNSKRITLLLAFLFYHHKRVVNTVELIDILWGEGECRNPRGAIKTLVYRAREMLRRLWPSAQFWITQDEGYCWNPDYRIDLDVDRLNELVMAYGQEDVRTAVKTWMDLYKKDFLSSCSENYWAEYMRFYYKSQYFNMMKSYYRQLEMRGMYDQIEHLARHGMEIDNTEELSHLWFVRACLQQHKFQLATTAYQHALDTMYEGQEEQASDQLQELGKLIRIKRGNGTLDLDAILASMPKERVGHAVFCDVTTFQKLYTVQQRFIKRYGGQYSVVLLNWQELEGVAADEQQTAYLIRELQDTLCGCIRGGDVITHYSDYQFLILLYDASRAGAEIVVDRINGRIERKAALRKRIIVSSEIKELSVLREETD